MTKSTSGGCDQFETSPEAIDQELHSANVARQTDRDGVIEYRSMDLGQSLSKPSGMGL